VVPLQLVAAPDEDVALLSLEGERACAIELALEGLFLARKIGKDTDGSETVYG